MRTGKTWHLKTWFKLLLAGWRPDRDGLKLLALPGQFDLFPEARRVLVRYGGLSFGGDKLIDLSPSTIEEEFAPIASFSERIETPCYPIGSVDGHDHFALFLDLYGRVYALGCNVEPFALDFEQALDFLLRTSIGRQEKEGVIRDWGRAREGKGDGPEWH